MRIDTRAGKFEVNLLAEPGILGCLRWVMAKAGAGPGCSLLLRRVGGEKMSFVPEFLKYELVLSNA